MRITFDTPVTIGDMSHQITVAKMDVVTIAFNLKADRVKGESNVSITLECPDTGYQQHVVYQDTTTVPAFWSQVSGLQLSGEKWIAPLVRRLVSDGKLPSGALS